MRYDSPLIDQKTDITWTEGKSKINVDNKKPITIWKELGSIFLKEQDIDIDIQHN